MAGADVERLVVYVCGRSSQDRQKRPGDILNMDDRTPGLAVAVYHHLARSEGKT